MGVAYQISIVRNLQNIHTLYMAEGDQDHLRVGVKSEVVQQVSSLLQVQDIGGNSLGFTFRSSDWTGVCLIALLFRRSNGCSIKKVLIITVRYYCQKLVFSLQYFNHYFLREITY